MKKMMCLAMTAASLFAIAPSALAASGDMMVRMRAIQVMPDEAGTPTLVGGDAKISNSSVPEVDISYFVTNNFAMELVLATTTHEVSVYNSTGPATLDLGDVSLLPPTLLAQYHHEMGSFKPYVGAGINYTMFYGENSGAMKEVTYDNSFGYALQVGADYKMADNIYFNVDVKKLKLSTDLTATTYGDVKVTADVDIDPYIVGLGVGFRF